MDVTTAMGYMQKGAPVQCDSSVFTMGSINSLEGDGMSYIFDWKDVDYPVEFQSLGDWMLDNQSKDFKLYEPKTKDLTVYEAIKLMRKGMWVKHDDQYIYFLNPMIDNPWKQTECVMRYGSFFDNSMSVFSLTDFIERHKNTKFEVYEKSKDNS